MRLHQLKSNLNKKPRKRVGRGGKKGSYSGRGMKGQKSRAGGKPRIGFAGGDTSLTKRLPKQRGQVGKTEIKKGTKLFRLRIRPVIFNLKDFNKKFFAKDGSSFVWSEKEIISPKSLLEKGLINRIKGKIPHVKILGVGKLKKKLNFSGVALSKSAREKLGIKEKPVKKKVAPKKRTTKRAKVISKASEKVKKLVNKETKPKSKKVKNE